MLKRGQFEKIVIPGRPYTKKNSQQIYRNKYTGKPKIAQSDQYQNYETICLWYLKKYKEKFTGLIEITALYWMPNKQSWPDLLGLEQATADILQKAGIINNDRNILNWDGSRIAGIDKENPRVEIQIREVEKCG
jgi:Holliday junction resolvase RusA-like endonuclease